jgi:hypothetical protein
MISIFGYMDVRYGVAENQTNWNNQWNPKMMELFERVEKMERRLK